ncbi:MAG: hypothetical protein ABIS86_15980 [Streptosporangiaceae bacterium]
MNQMLPAIVATQNFMHDRVERLKNSTNDRGAGLVEYAALLILAVAILGALWQSGVVTELGTKTKDAVTNLFKSDGPAAPAPAAT